jgi:hypothetical protein
MYKVPDREGLYVAVTTKGSVSFRYNYSLNGRQETLTLGLYGDGGITLNEARERLNDAKRLILKGVSPAREKARSKERVSEAKSFGDWAELWLRGYRMKACKAAGLSVNHRIFWKFDELKSDQFAIQDGKVRFKP